MNLLAETDARCYGAATLRHPVDFRFLHVEPRKSRDAAEKIGGKQNALAADTHERYVLRVHD
jgi:hypothetical protein